MTAIVTQIAVCTISMSTSTTGVSDKETYLASCPTSHCFAQQLRSHKDHDAVHQPCTVSEQQLWIVYQPVTVLSVNTAVYKTVLL